MSTSLAFISAKGGSGKTTLALSMADLLRRCQVKTLLIDCDFSTNGATYFYEAYLAEHNAASVSSIHSLYEVLFRLDGQSESPIELLEQARIDPLTIDEYLSFLPSIPEVSKKYCASEPESDSGWEEEKNRIEKLYDWARSTYDVILLDCQAGYSPILSAVLPLVDIDLFVLETDTISASAMRSLHLKIGDHLGHAKLYQIFNKATPEEAENYSKITGTFFVNIGTLQFDWKIRQAFSRSQIPDIENNSANYGFELCEVCKTLFRTESIQNKLEEFKNELKYRQLEERRSQIQMHLLRNIEYSKHITLQKIIISLLVTSIALILSLFFERLRKAILNLDLSTILGLIAMFTSMMIFSFDMRSGFSRSRKKEHFKLESELKEIEKEMQKIEKQQSQ